ncbi:MAG: Uma2 family endonuclease [Solirubrobacteraceae bacterium]|nr:Uma2 family endonuclease [Solirubrobacteraceae bacterium]
MAVHVDASLPVHPLTVDDVVAMVDAGILGEDDKVELLDGVLVEMSPQGSPHATAIRRLNRLLMPVVQPAGFDVSPQCPLDVLSPISLPEPDIAIVPISGWDAHAAGAVLVIEVSVTSRAIDLGRKAAIYAAAGIPEYWVLDLADRRLLVHREPAGDGYADVVARTDADEVTAAHLPLTVAVAELLPPRP